MTIVRFFKEQSKILLSCADKLYIQMDQLFSKPFIAYDGSQACDKVMEIYKCMCSGFEKSNFVFVWDPCKNYIPKTCRGPAIEQKLKTETTDLKNINIKIVEREHDSEKSVNQCLLEEFFIAKSSFIILGFYGSKGEKSRQQDLSSRVHRFVYDSKVNIALVKTFPKNTSNLLFCFDGSEISKQGLQKAIDFCTKFNNNLTIFHGYNPDTKEYSKRIKTYLKTIQQSKKNSLKIDIIIVESEVVPYLNQKEANFDWIMINKNGYRGELSHKKYVGSTASDILAFVKTNLIILA